MIKNFFVVVIAIGMYFFGLSLADKNFSDAIFFRGEKFSMAQGDEKELKKLYHEMWQALLAKDIATLNKIHSDDFVLVHMTGLNQSKEEYLRCVRDGELNYFTEDTENIFIKVNGDKAKLTGQSKVNAAVFGGDRHTWRLQLAFDVEKIYGEWILTYAKASTY